MVQVPAVPNIGTPAPLSTILRTGDRFAGVRLLGWQQLRPPRAAGRAVHELSGLAWSEDDAILYAVSDEGLLIRLRPVFSGDFLADVAWLGGAVLRDEAGAPLAGAATDSEGLAIRRGANGRAGDSELLVSFEKRPRICSYRPDGTLTGCTPPPGALATPSRYRGANRMLEALTVHPSLGPVTGPERSLEGEASSSIHLYAGEASWNFPAAFGRAGRLTGLATLPDGALLVLENRGLSLGRNFETAVHLLQPFENDWQVKTLLRTDEGELGTANFEGIASHRGRRFFLISDNNRIGQSLLLYLERLPATRSAPLHGPPG